METELSLDFLSQVGAEEPMSADQVVWSEQGRLHLSYKGNVSKLTSGWIVLTITIELILMTMLVYTELHGVRVNDTISYSDPEAELVQML